MAVEALPNLKRTLDGRGGGGLDAVEALDGHGDAFVKLKEALDGCRGLEAVEEVETLSNLEMTWTASEGFVKLVKDLVLSLERYCRLLSPFGTEFKDILVTFKCFKLCQNSSK